MNPADALRSCAFTLSVTADPAQAEHALTVAAERGVPADDLAQLRAEWHELVAPAVVHSTAVVSPRCGCGHVGFRHVAEHGRCQARLCRCVRFLVPAPAFSAEELATLHRFENTRPAPESYRPDEDERAIPARFDERYDPSPEPIDRSIQ